MEDLHVPNIALILQTNYLFLRRLLAIAVSGQASLKKKIQSPKQPSVSTRECRKPEK